MPAGNSAGIYLRVYHRIRPSVFRPKRGGLIQEVAALPWEFMVLTDRRATRILAGVGRQVRLPALHPVGHGAAQEGSEGPHRVPGVAQRIVEGIPMLAVFSVMVRDDALEVRRGLHFPIRARRPPLDRLQIRPGQFTFLAPCPAEKLPVHDVFTPGENGRPRRRHSLMAAPFVAVYSARCRQRKAISPADGAGRCVTAPSQ